MPLIRDVPSFLGALQHFRVTRGSAASNVHPADPYAEERGDGADEDSETDVDVDEDNEDDDADVLDPEFDDEEMSDDLVARPRVPRGPR